MEKITIGKAKNFDSETFICSRCGRRIKHAYYIGCGSDLYGSECVSIESGLSQRVCDIRIKKINNFHRALKGQYSLQKNHAMLEKLEFMDITFEEYIDQCIKNGKI